MSYMPRTRTFASLLAGVWGYRSFSCLLEAARADAHREARLRRGHVLVSDEPAGFAGGAGGENAGPTPTGFLVAAFAAEANEAFPALGLQPHDVTLVHRGLLPAVQVVEYLRAFLSSLE